MKPRWIFLPAAALFVCHLALYSDHLIDDTFISVRYAKNWVDGHGLVFNPGERVEGYTNFSFVVLAALFLKLGLEPVFWIKGLTLAAALGMLALLSRLERRLVPGREPGASVLLLLPLQCLAYWSVSGMETMFFTALLIGGIVQLLRESEARAGCSSAGIFVLLALTRPEGIFCFAVCNGVFLLLDLGRRAGPGGAPLAAHPDSEPETSRAQHAAPPQTERPSERAWGVLGRYTVRALIFTVLYGGYFLWRYEYYGHLFPNTFYAKVTGGAEQGLTGLEYLLKWALCLPAFAAMLLAPASAFVLRPSRGIAAVYAILLAYVVYVVSVGGDFMAHLRFFFPVLPLCSVLLCWLLHPLRHRDAAVAAICLLQVLGSAISAQRETAFVAHRFTVVGKHVGRWLAETAGPQDLIAVNTAGAVPYFSGLPAIDMLGLTDEKIARRPVYIVSTGWSAHRRGWGEYVLERRPRFILWYNMAGARDPFYLTDRELADDPFFRFFYQLKTKTLPGDWVPAEPRLVTYFLGFPFGSGPEGQEAPSGDMGLKLRFQSAPVPLTTFHEGPIVVNYFERDARDDGLWALREPLHRDVDRFVDAVAGRWSQEPDPGFHPAARARVEAMCLEAQRLLEAGHPVQSTRLLTEAEALNHEARSPLVYQYLANLAVMAGDPFVAVRAQKEALRLDPRNELYRSNFKALLRLPYADAKKGRS